MRIVFSIVTTFIFLFIASFCHFCDRKDAQASHLPQVNDSRPSQVKIIVQDPSGVRLGNAYNYLTIAPITSPRYCPYEGQNGTFGDAPLGNGEYMIWGSSGPLQICCNAGGSTGVHYTEQDNIDAFRLTVTSDGYNTWSGRLFDLSGSLLYNGGTSTYVVTLTPSYTYPSPYQTPYQTPVQYGQIQGYKVVMPGNQPIPPADSQRIFLDGVDQGNNPGGVDSSPYTYYLYPTAGAHTVSMSAPPGYVAGYTHCTGPPDTWPACHAGTPTIGSIAVNVPANGNVELWWHLIPKGRILGRVWNDVNGNGAHDAGEKFILDPSSTASPCTNYLDPKLDNVLIHITGPESSTEKADLCNADPWYDTGLIEPGQYSARVTLPLLWVATGITQGSELAPQVNWTKNPEDKAVISGNLRSATYEHIWFGVGKLPTCNILASPDAVNAGEQVAIGWSSSANAVSATLETDLGNPIPVALTGTQLLYPTKTITITMTVTNPVGSNTCRRTITVLQPPGPEDCDFNGDGAVTREDLDMFNDHLGAGLGDPRYDGRFDLYTDLVINAQDINVCSPFVQQPQPPSPPPTPSPSPDLITIKPRPCEEGVETDKLTDNFITTATGEAPKSYDFTATGPIGSVHTYSINEDYPNQIDFSQLQALFGYPASDYLEGPYQRDGHSTTNLLDLNSVELNKYHGPVEKATPRTLVDEQKVRYVAYINNKQSLPESQSTFTTFDNKYPKTIKQMIDEFGTPNPPSSGSGRAAWLSSWGQYWDKIPTSYNELYKGKLEFRITAGEEDFQALKDGSGCASFNARTVEFLVPDFGRTALVSDLLNATVVPYAAQSFRDHRTLAQGVGQAPSGQSLAAKTIQLCKKMFSAPVEVAKNLKRVISSTLNNLNPVKTVHAQEAIEGRGCLQVPAPGKEGVAPYCALPPGQIQPGDSCIDKISANKLNKDNPNVVCNLRIQWSINRTIDPNDKFWDSCTDNGNGTYTCKTKLRLFPDFRVPWIAEIWNNTLYSDEREGSVQRVQGVKDEAGKGEVKGTTEIFGGGVGSPQETGRPGLYSFFMPKVLYNQVFPPKVILPPDFQENFDKYYDNGDQVAGFKIREVLIPCLIDQANSDLIFSDKAKAKEVIYQCTLTQLGLNLPGQVPVELAAPLKQRFVGATDCGKHYSRDLSLKPEALQQHLGITRSCAIFGKAIAEQTIIPGGGTPPTPGNCTAASDGDPTNGIETSPEELACYIIEKAAGQIEPITGNDLAKEMMDVMFAESGGKQCSVAAAGEIGIFQYTAETWKGSGPGVPNIDSGSGTLNQYRAGKTVCWGLPGPDPKGSSGYSGFDWSIQFGGTKDGEAWNPYLQVENTVRLFLRAEACRWSTFKNLHPGVC